MVLSLRLEWGGPGSLDQVGLPNAKMALEVEFDNFAVTHN
jgi:hypothetical protein